MTSVLSYLLQGAALGLAAAASPGTFQAFLINQSLVGGFRRGAPVAFSPFISDPPLVVTIVLLLGWLPENFLNLVSLVGGCFAIYLAWGSWKTWRKNAADPLPGPGPMPTQEANLPDEHAQDKSADHPSTWGILLRGAVMNLLSPGPYTFWTLMVGPLLLDAFDLSIGHALAFLLGFYGLFVGGMLGIAALFHQARRLGPSVVRALTLASILILLVFGLVLLRRGLG